MADDPTNYYKCLYPTVVKILLKYSCIQTVMQRQWLKWFGEAGWGAHPTKPGWSKPHTHSNPINLALFRHKITLCRFNQGPGLILLQGGGQI